MVLFSLRDLKREEMKGRIEKRETEKSPCLEAGRGRIQVLIFGVFGLWTPGKT